MSETLLTIQEAAELSGKSIQTIRRALKSNKLESKKKKTPQGFNYLVVEESLIRLYKLKNIPADRVQRSIQDKPQEPESKAVSTEFASMEDLRRFEQSIEQLIVENKQEKENFMRLLKAFQDRFVVLENQFKLLEQPKKKWYRFWK